MKLLELFAGSRSFSKIAEEKYGMQTFTIDIEPFEKIDLVKDIEFIDINEIPFIPDVIWASPPCTTYSIAAISHHREGIKAISKEAQKGDILLNKTVELIKYFQVKNPQLKFFIENPMGMMRKMPVMKQFDRATLTYCSYGDTRMKPTDIWSNTLATIYNPKGWRPLIRCFNGNIHCHHESAPRGSKSGTQGLIDDYERSKVPQKLCEEILNNIVTNEREGILNNLVSNMIFE